MVAHTGFEPVISSLRGRCPRPLDECASYVESRASYRHNDNYYTTEIQQAIQGADSLTEIYRDNFWGFIVEIRALYYSLNFSLKYLCFTSLAFVFAHDSKPIFLIKQRLNTLVL